MKTPLVRTAIVALALVMCAASAQSHTLYELYMQVLEDNPGLKRRAGELEQARAQVDLSRSRLLPQISADITRTSDIAYRDELSGVTQRYGGLRRTFQLRQALLDLSSWYGLNSSRGRVLQAEQAADAARMLVAGDLVERYLAVLLAEDEVTRLTAEHSAVDAQVLRLQKMHDRQMAKVTDLYEAQAYLQTLETLTIDARAGRAIALEKLQEVAGTPVLQVATLVLDAVPRSEDRKADQWEKDALDHNPLLLSLQLAVEAAQDQVRSVRAQHAPVVSLLVSNLYSDQGYDSRLQAPYQVETLGVQVTFSIYEGGRVEANVRDALSRQDIAEQQYEESRREVIRQVRTDYLHAAASHARIDSTNRERESRSRAVEAQERGYQLGAATIVAVLDARKLLLKADSDQHAARYDLIRDMVALRVHAGVLDEAAVRESSAWFFHADAESTPQ